MLFVESWDGALRVGLYKSIAFKKYFISNFEFGSLT